MNKIPKFECCLDLFIDYYLTNTGEPIYVIHWNALAYFFLFLWLFLPFRVFIGCFIVFVLEPQMPLWNPLIDRTRHLFLTYGEAKHFLIKFTWISIGIFTFLHLRRYV